MRGERITVVIPAFNEETTIGAVVKEVRGYVDEVVVIDDGSDDKTADKARNAGATVVVHEFNRGYDRSIEAGFELAVELGATILITFDADGQHLADDIPSVLAPIRAGTADVVVGRRPTPHRVSERLFAWYAYYRAGISDPLCGFKAYRVSVYQDIGHFDEHNTIGTQLTFEAKSSGYDIAEVDVSINKREDEPRFGSQFEANVKIFTALCRLIWFDLITKSSPN